MKLFQSTVELPCHKSEVFDFVSQPQNLIDLLMPANVKHVDYEVPPRLEVGSQMRVSFKQFGMHIEIVHEVIEMLQTERILLHQMKGPFRRWVHEFSFEATSAETTNLGEKVQFEGPRGMLGFVITDHKIMDALKTYSTRAHAMLRDHFCKPGRTTVN